MQQDDQGSVLPHLRIILLYFFSAALTIITSDIEYFIHTRMKIICFKHITQFIHQRENDFVNIRMQRTLAFAIQTIRIWPMVHLWHYYLRRFIQLRVNGQKFVRFICVIDVQANLFRNDPDIITPATINYLFDITLT